MSARRFLIGGIAIGLAATAAMHAGCKSTPKSELMIAVTTDLTPGKDFDRLQIEVVSGNNPKQTRRFEEIGSQGLLTFPFTFALVEGTEDTDVQVRILAGSSAGVESEVGSPLLIREIVTRMPKEGISLLRVHLDWLCLGAAKARADRSVVSSCDRGLTCIAGRCADWTVDSSKLPAFDERDVFGGTSSAAGDGDCFDTARCFGSGFMAQVRKEDCSIAPPAGGAGTNVALVPVPGAGGVCGSAACFAPLDSDGNQGWERRGERIVVPPPACERIGATSGGQRALVGIAVTTTCNTKSQRLPTCGDWSSARGNAATFFVGPPAGYPTDGGTDGDAVGDAPNDGASE